MDTKSIVQVFDNPEFGSIRAMRGEDGEPWFVAKDVCGVLGYTNPSKAIADHVDAEDKLNNETLSSLGQRGGWLVNESGLYSLILTDGTCLVGELAKMLRQNGVEVGQNRLFAILREDGYLGKSGSNRNVPTQRAMEQGLFRIKETSIVHTDGHVTISRTPKVTGKGQRVFLERYLGASEIVSA